MSILFRQKLHAQNSAKAPRAFSLVEMLVYISVLIIVSGGSLTLLFSLTDRIQEQRAHQLVMRSAQSTLERILAEVRAADTVDPSSVFETTPGTLVLAHGTTTTELFLTGDRLVYEINSGQAVPLSDEKVSVDALRFFTYDNTATEMVRIMLTITATVGDTTVTKDFNASAILRGSYE